MIPTQEIVNYQLLNIFNFGVNRVSLESPQLNTPKHDFNILI